MAQISLRSALWAVTCVAVLCALASPHVRTWETARLIRLGIILIVFVLGAVLPMLVAALMQRRTISKAGKELLAIGQRDQKYALLIVWGLIFIGPVTMSSTVGFNLLYFEPLGYASEAMPVFEGHHVLQYLVILFAGAQLGIGLSSGLWLNTPSIYFCEHGIAYGGYLFAKWNQVKLRSWDVGSGLLSLYIRRSSADHEIPAPQRQAVDEILRTKLGSPLPKPTLE